MFTLLNLESSELVSRAQFVDGKAASRAARLLTRKTGKRFQPRPAPVAVDWQARERGRFDSGEYVRIHAELESISLDSHFAHVAKKNPELIAYTRDALKGAADKQSLLSIAAYVELVAPLDWNETDKARVVEAQRDHAATLCSPLKWAKTPDEIEAVYTNYDSSAQGVGASCMRYDAKQLDARVDGKPYHPVRVYGAGDLAIAYLTNASGETIARALTWPAKKLYSRLYCGEDSSLSRLLQAQGFSGSRYYGGTSLRGARLLRVETDNGDLVCPYLDEVGNVEDYGDFLRIGGDIDAQTTNGVIISEPAFICESCQEPCDEAEARTVYTRPGRRGEESWCEYCCGNQAFYCYGYEEYFSDNLDSGEMGGETYSLEWLEDNAYLCERDDEWTDSVTAVVIDESGNTESWGENALERDAYEYAGTYYSEDVELESVIFERAAYFVQAWRALVFLRDIVQPIPRFLIDEARENGEPIAFEAQDGRFYAVDYVDHYPIDRPRKVPAEDGQMILEGVAE